VEKAGVEKSGVEAAGLEYTGVESVGVGDRCGKCRSDNGWKAVRKETKSKEKYRAYKIPTI